jgi:serine/threonine protein kinase/tetratricopeptide (TPR) repeat protein
MAGKPQDVFENAIDLNAGEREAYLRGACGSDDQLRAEVDSLLRAHERAAGFLASPTAADHPAAAATLAAPLREGPGTRIGPYKILQLIGEGGFGSVFMAEQTSPVQRKVALKIIKPGMDTRQVVARFEQERQALAMMDHPNIARVLDAGATENGRPFFVMELVKGDPIVEYCDRNNQSVHDRLELFAQVCDAVQHAHTKGIIHRDLKPSNILVSMLDGRPSTKVIDFGIAKATGAQLTEKTLFTEHRQLIGTPEYMSPEQAEGSMDIDTRSDVYSLGVLLYELLTGVTPFSGQELRSAAYAEIQRIIREVEPPKPSTRLSQNSDTIAGVAARRHTEPRKLGTIIRGDLDWIVMKALEKNRQRRYDTASGLAMDIRRYLDGEAVTAAPPGRLYQLRKFVRRNRVMVGTSAAIAATLLISATAFAWQAGVARDQRDVAVAAKREAGTQRDRAVAAEADARASASEAKRAQAAAEDNARLAEAQATLALGAIQKLTTLASTELITPGTSEFKKSVLEVALASVGQVSENYQKSTSKEATAAAIYNTLGKLLMQLGQSGKALDNFQRSLEIASERVKIKEYSDPSRMNLAKAHSAVGMAREAVDRDMKSVLDHQLECVKIVQDVYDHPKADGNQMDRKEVATTLAESVQLVGVTYYRLGDLKAAAAHFRRALALREELAHDEPNARSSLQNLGLSYLSVGDSLFRLGENDEARRYLERSLEARKSVCALASAGDSDRSDLGGSYYMLGAFQLRTGDLQRAGENLERSLEIRRAVAAQDPKIVSWQRFVAVSLYWLGSLAERQGDAPAAAGRFAESRAISEQLAKDDPANDKRQIELMLVLPHVGEVAAGAAIADRFATRAQLDNELRTDLVRCYVQCARHTPSEQADEAKQFHAKAIQVLRDAIGSGYSDRVYLATEPDLAPLAQDPEFAALLEGIRQRN